MKRFTKLMRILFLIGFLLQIASIGSADKTKPEYFVDESKLPFDALAGTNTVRYWGIHKGAAYKIEVPEEWNGKLVVYCHGYAGDGLELTVNEPPSIRQNLIKNGYAWAASSYGKNGYDVTSGVKDTHALTLFFNGLVGKPKRIYIAGHSMGGHIIGVAIEQYPKLYDGALPMCGVMADNKLFDYFQDYHLLAQYLTDQPLELPFPENYSADVIPAMRDLMSYYLAGDLVFPVYLNETGTQLKTALKYISGGQRPLYDYAFMYWADFLFTQIIDHEMVGNMDTVYQLDDDRENTSKDEAAVNNEIYRREPLTKYRKPNGLANVPAISGDLPIPVMTLHTLGDMFVPFSMQQIYAQRAESKGKSDLLVQRAIRGVGHCDFTAEEQWQAFTDLVSWVEDGSVPEGNDVLDPETVAEPCFGCQFTTQDRAIPFSVPCPE